MHRRWQTRTVKWLLLKHQSRQEFPEVESFHRAEFTTHMSCYSTRIRLDFDP